MGRNLHKAFFNRLRKQGFSVNAALECVSVCYAEYLAAKVCNPKASVGVWINIAIATVSSTYSNV